MQIVVVSTRGTAARARLTVRRARSVVPDAGVHVLDLDAGYVAVADERVLCARDVGIASGTLRTWAVLLDGPGLARAAHPPLVRSVLADGPGPVLVLAAGVVLEHRPDDLLDAADRAGVCLVARCATPPDDDRRPDLTALVRGGGYAPTMLALAGDQDELLALWQAAAVDPAGPGDRWLDLAAALVPHDTVRDAAVLLSAGSLRPEHEVRLHSTGDGGRAGPGLRLDGRPVVAVDLSGLDPTAPWLLDADSTGDPRGRLSDHPALAGWVADQAVALLAEESALGAAPVGLHDLSTTSLGTPVDEPLRALYRLARGDDLSAGALPDPFDPASRGAFLDWLADPAPDGGPGRYLQALRSTRTDLQSAFPHVPGADTAAFLAWATTHGPAEGYPVVVLEEAVRRAAPPRRPAHGRLPAGVNVVGYLRGELGIGESARLMISALRAADIPHAAVAVDRHLASRQRADAPQGTAGEGVEVYDTSLICVNADLTASVAASVPAVVARSYRIGMWYWEVEEFPASQHAAFGEVDEVWVATEFVRAAVEPHSPVPVVTMTPPLPQRGGAPALGRADLGLPDAPLFLFSFDYLSTAERKNPLGLIEAFSAAFAPGEGPVLVIKSINADRRPSEAERLRLRAAARPDVLLLEDYLDADARDALVALCDCYVSLHRSEGLGLTIAEAMAWARPVIATAYSGNLDFMTDENSFLVPWTATTIPSGAEPYPAGGTWADPDLTAAAALMRLVVDDPAEAARRGARAAEDIASRHSPAVVGARVAARLEETAARRRARSRLTVAARLREAARGARGSLG